MQRKNELFDDGSYETEFGTESLSRGLFWVICGFDEDGTFAFSDCEFAAFLIPCDRMGHVDQEHEWMMASNNHKAAWPIMPDDCVPNMKNLPWNYYPRGRVEINNGKAIVYYHPDLQDMEGFEERIIEEFGLDSEEIKTVSFKADGSAHYTEGVGKEKIHER